MGCAPLGLQEGYRAATPAFANMAAFVPLTGGFSVKYVGLRPATCALPAARARVAAAPVHAAPTAKMFDWKNRADPDYAKLEGDGIFTLTNLRPAPGSKHRKKRKGRGHGAGQGGSCGFGMRGQKSRSGRPSRPGFEGGQTPLYRRVPKFTGRPTGPGHTKTEYSLMKIEFLNGCEENSIVTFESLKEAGLMTKQKRKLTKVTGGAELKVKGLTVKAHAFTSSAVEAIEGAGGKCVLVSPTTGKDVVMEDNEE
jgi:large subunit ribosomal protein L15